MLVDPVLRLALLAELPDRPRYDFAREGGYARASPRQPSRKRARSGVPVALCAAAGAVVALAASASASAPPSHAAAAADAPRLEPAGEQPAPEAQLRPPRRSTARPAKTAPRRAKTPHRRASSPTRRGKTPAPRRSATTQPRARTFAWPRVPRARSYVVRVFRGGERIFEKSVSHPRIEIPSTWAFGGHRYGLRPGIYEWSVRPHYANSSRTRYGEAVVRATLTITAARG